MILVYVFVACKKVQIMQQKISRQPYLIQMSSTALKSDVLGKYVLRTSKISWKMNFMPQICGTLGEKMKLQVGWQCGMQEGEQ